MFRRTVWCCLILTALAGCVNDPEFVDIPDDAVAAQDDAQPDETPPDDAVTDTNVPDDAVTDTTIPDDTVPDTAVPDDTIPDTAVPDTVQPDTAQPDTAVPDTAVPDTAQPDTAVPDVDNAPTVPASMTVSVTTTTYNGEFSPKNVFAIWLESATGTYIHSMGVWAQNYKIRLTRWYSKSSHGAQGMTDAVTGASRKTHKTETVSLNLSKFGVPAGDYKVWFELNETNGGSKSTSTDISLGPGGTVTATNNTTNIKNISVTFTP